MQSWHWILWNLFLAAIPVPLAYLLGAGAEAFTLRRRRVPWLVWLPLAVVWFAFLPNTCYLLTEWRHFLFGPRFEGLRDAADTNRLVWLSFAKYGLFFLFYSAFGVLCFTLSVRPIEALLRRARINPLPWAVPFFLLISLGVYMGLIVRLNSWEIVTRPDYVFGIAWNAVIHPRLCKAVITFAALLWLLYETVDIWVDGLNLRLTRWGLLRRAG
jgi:uncharacterized membrane protein